MYMRSKCRLLAASVVLATTGVSLFGQSASTLTEGAKWESSAAFGFTVTQGNSDTILTSLNLVSTKKWEKNEVTGSAVMTYGQNQGQRTSDNQRFSLQYNRLISEKAFVYGRLDALRDTLANVDYSLTFSPGGGYYFWKDPKLGFVRMELGPGYIIENKGGDITDHITMRGAERFEYKVNDLVKVWQSLEYLPVIDKFSIYRIVSEIGVETKLMKSLTLRSYIQESFDNSAAAGRKRNDLTFVTQVGFKF
jgi:putative salt-induced outer membrane protein YdiY